MRRIVGIVILCVMCALCGESRSAKAASSVYGGSLLSEGEVAMTFGVGFPEATFQFDFANSKSFNFAFRGKFNYNFGFPLFGVQAGVSAPMRIGLIQNSSLDMALEFEPGFITGYYGVGVGVGIAGFNVGAGLMFSINPVRTLVVNFGLRIPITIVLEPSSTSGLVSTVIPIEATGGVEYEWDENFSLFGMLAIGPMIYAGHFASRINLDASRVAVNGTARFMIGLIWRR